MKKKSIIALTLSTILTLSAAVPAFAAEDNTFTQADTTTPQNTTVTYNEAKAYSVTIPSTVEWKKEGTQKITATLAANPVLGMNEQVKVTIGGLTNDKIVLKAGTGDNEATINVPLDSTEPLWLEGGGAATASYTLQTVADKIYAGDYTGTVTFTVGSEVHTTP